MNAASRRPVDQLDATRPGLQMAWIYRAILMLGVAAIVALGFLIDPYLFPSRVRICGLIVAALIVLAIQPTLIASFFLARRVTSPPLPSDLHLGVFAALRTYDREIDASMRGVMWANPFLARRAAPRASGTPQPIAVLFLHGYFCNRGVWRPAMTVIASSGYPVEGVTLEPAFGAIENYVEPIDTAITRLLAAHALTRVVLVAHSMGAIAARHYLEQTADARVEQLICVGAPHHGTIAARFGRSRNTRQIGRDSFWLESLNGSTRYPRDRILNIYSAHDDVVFPYGTSHLEGADNRQLSGIGHVSLLYHKDVRSLILQRLTELG